jgi:hypothetical protein
MYSKGGQMLPGTKSLALDAAGAEQLAAAALEITAAARRLGADSGGPAPSAQRGPNNGRRSARSTWRGHKRGGRTAPFARSGYGRGQAWQGSQRF